MNVSLLTFTPEPEAVVAAAAKVCYSPLTLDDIITKAFAEDNESYLAKLADAHHESPLEHASFTFAVEGVSRSLLAQLTRHRIASYSVRSQRYVSEIGFDYVIPPAIAADAQASYIFDGAMGALDMEYRQLVKRLTEVHAATGMSLGEAKKKAQEDARFVLPNACCTQLVFTMNARALLNFFAKRCCNRAQWEIRQMANEMLALCKGVAPNIFASAGAPCLRGVCPEGKMSCKAERGNNHA